MKLFNKTAIALTLSLLGATCSVSALAMATGNSESQEVEVAIEENINKNMNVFVSVDGEVTTVDVSPSAMNDPEELRILLADVPEDIREKLIENLTRAKVHQSNFKVIVDGDGDVEQELHWISEGDHNIEVIEDDGENRVIVMEFDGDNSEVDASTKVINKMVHSSMKSVHRKNLQIVHQGNMSADSILRMIKHSDYTADELNEIQQALDAKR